MMVKKCSHANKHVVSFQVRSGKLVFTNALITIDSTQQQ